jgi:hypothetical protein
MGTFKDALAWTLRTEKGIKHEVKISGGEALRHPARSPERRRGCDILTLEFVLIYISPHHINSFTTPLYCSFLGRRFMEKFACIRWWENCPLYNEGLFRGLPA